jgi:hypothetical protein
VSTISGEDQFVPSVTWITQSYPKGVGYMKWFASKGYDEAEAIKEAGVTRGSKVHALIYNLINGKDVPMEARYTNPKNGLEEELTLDEYEAGLSFVEW